MEKLTRHEKRPQVTVLSARGFSVFPASGVVGLKNYARDARLQWCNRIGRSFSVKCCAPKLVWRAKIFFNTIGKEKIIIFFDS